ncbi:MAG: hypothetical protein NVSMB62_17810 [Acidobacteriaceae bacterium]
MWQVAGVTKTPLPQPEYMHYVRALSVARGGGQACVLLDAEVFPHSAPALADLRLLSLGGNMREIPYVVTMSQTASDDTQHAPLQDLVQKDGGIAFDLAMPGRAYTDVVLQIDPAVHDFIGTATVTGSNAPGEKGTALGTLTLFDLAGQHLSRDTTLRLVESAFPYLHVVLRVSAAPGRPQSARFLPAMVTGAEVLPSREDQVLFTTVASTSAATTGSGASAGRTRFDLNLPMRVPVERVSFDLPQKSAQNFSRQVTIRASPEGMAAGGNVEGAAVESVSGAIIRVHAVIGGREIRRVQLSVPAVLGANLQGPAHVWVDVGDGSEPPLPLTAVRLEMRQRKVCFEPPSEGGVALFYGDADLSTPTYEYQRTFRPVRSASVATLGPEMRNPAFRERHAALKPFNERHPEVLWIALIGVVCALGVVALKAARTAGR